MAFRNSESRIPGGFTLPNANKLGYSSLTSEGFCIISYLPKGIAVDDNLDFWNQWVVFFDKQKFNAGDDVEYEYSTVFKSSTGATKWSNTRTSNIPVLMFKGHELLVAAKKAITESTTLEVSIKISTGGTIYNIDIIHDILGLSLNIENAITTFDGFKVPYAGLGNIDYFRKCGNLLGSYLSQAKAFYKGSKDIHQNIYSYLTYTTVMDESQTIYSSQLYEEDLNNSSYSLTYSDAKNIRIGVCSISPFIGSMFMEKNNAPYTTLSRKDSATDIKETWFNNYKNLNVDDRIDIYNKLRFPKSCILSCAEILNEIKKASSYKDVTKNSTSSNKIMMRRLVTEFDRGPMTTDQYKRASTLSVEVQRKAFSYFTPLLIAARAIPPIEYEVIRIKVLDIRSGKPIKNAKVKRLIIDSDDDATPTAALRLGDKKYIVKDNAVKESESHKFDFEPSSGFEFNDTDTLSIQAQKALHHLGYLNGAPGPKIGTQGRLMYKKYWEDRMENFVFDPLNIDDNKLAWIVNEYLHHRQTDELGNLNVIVPKKLLDSRKLHIEVGFWGFSTALERIKATSTPFDRMISRTNNIEESTFFQVNWIGNDTLTKPILPGEPNSNEQNIDWDKNIDGSRHFGWQVNNNWSFPDESSTSSYLKIAQKLMVKETYTSYSSLNLNRLSKFYDLETYPFHFVLLGMQWCQPVWEPISSDIEHFVNGGISPSLRVSLNTSGANVAHPNSGQPQGAISRINESNRTLPFIVTRYKAASNNQFGFGRDYGTLVSSSLAKVYSRDHNNINLILTDHYLAYKGPRTKTSGNKPHYGMDYFAVANRTPVFALCSGKVSLSSTSTSLFGERIRIYKSGFSFTYAHLHTRYVSINELVYCGQKVAIAGRTGDNGLEANYPDYAPTHLHLEISGDSSFTQTSALQDKRLAVPTDIVNYLNDQGKHSENEICLLNNSSRRLFPCDCSGGDEVDLAVQCKIKVNDTTGTNSVSNTCWASRNLHCPYMSGIFLIQAQLTFLHDDNANYTSPNGIDGGWGGGAKAAIKKFREIHESDIYNNSSIADPYKNFAAPQSDEEWEEEPGTRLNDPTAYILNQQARYPRINLQRVDH